jgi:hypothetical protein
MSKQQQLLGSREKWKRLANIVSRIEQNNHPELSHISRLQYIDKGEVHPTDFEAHSVTGCEFNR